MHLSIECQSDRTCVKSILNKAFATFILLISLLLNHQLFSFSAFQFRNTLLHLKCLRKNFNVYSYFYNEVSDSNLNVCL